MSVKLLLLKVFYLVCCITNTYSTNEKYRGDQILSILLPTEEISEKVHSYFKANQKVEVWSQGGKTCEIQLKHEQAEKFQAFCKKENISTKVVIHDVKQAIDIESKLNLKAENVTYVQDSPLSNFYAQQWNKLKFDYLKYNRFYDIHKELFRLLCYFGSLMKICYAGYSAEGRPLIIVKITLDIKSPQSKNKSIIWIDGGMHAREWISVASTMFMIKETLKMACKPGTKQNKLLKDNILFFVPVFNPDGYEYSHTNDRLWRKTRTKTKNSTCYGTDPNRNFDVQWGKNGSSNDPCSNDYQGTSPESEPCVRAFAKIMKYEQPLLKSYWNMHSYSQILYVPNGYKSEPPHDLPEIAQVAKEFIGSIHKRESSLYGAYTPASLLSEVVTGTAYDFVHDELNITFSFAIELRPLPQLSGFLLPPDEIKPTALETFDAILSSNDVIDRILKERKEKEKAKMVVS